MPSYILYSNISTDPGLLKIRHSHRVVAVVIQILIPFVFAPHFKERHIPRYNYIKQQQQKNPRGQETRQEQ